MSVEAMAIVLHHSHASGTDKVVLLGIANHDGDGGSFPSIATLARYANVSERSVQTSLRRLEQLGELEIHLQDGGTRDTRNDRRTNRYEITIVCPDDCDRSKNHHRPHGVQSTSPRDINGVQPASPRAEGHGVKPSAPRGEAERGHGVKCSAPRGEAERAHGVKPTSPEPSLEPSLEPSSEPSVNRGLVVVDAAVVDLPTQRSAEAGFARFWSAYPRRVGKDAARKAWTSALKRADAETIIAAAARFAADPNREDQFTAHPTTWLNRGSWEDPPLPPRTTSRARPVTAVDRLRDTPARPGVVIDVGIVTPTAARSR